MCGRMSYGVTARTQVAAAADVGVARRGALEEVRARVSAAKDLAYADFMKAAPWSSAEYRAEGRDAALKDVVDEIDAMIAGDEGWEL